MIHHTNFQWQMVQRLNNKSQLDLAESEIGFKNYGKAKEILQHIVNTTANIPVRNKAKQLMEKLP